MNYHNITKDDMLNGDGLRVVLWISGCNHCCEGCQNPQTWDINSGIPFDDNAKQELFEALDKNYISGVTFSGGDPLHPHNRKEVLQLAKEIKIKFPLKTVWIYTGYMWEYIRFKVDLSDVDVLLDGEYVKELNDNNLEWIGSSNQRVIDVQKSLKNNKIVLYKESSS